jgi:hypothetical protein
MMATPDLYRLAGTSTWIALVALVLSGIALALFFGGAGEFWGPVNDALIVVTVIALIPTVLAVARLAGDRAAPWTTILTVATIAGLILIAVGQTLLIVGRLSLEGSFVTGGVGIIPFLAWVVLIAVLGLGGGPIPDSVGRLAVAVIATVVAISVVGVLVSDGPLLWLAGVGLVVALSFWLAGLATTFGDRAAIA